MIISAVIAILIAGGVYLVMQRGMVRIIIGTTLMSHGVNILLLATGVGAWRAAPLADRPAVAAAPEHTAPEADWAGGDGDSTAGQETGTLTITLNGEETSFTPEIVRCEGEPGTLRNAVLTMKGDELPLVKVTPGEFALVKLQQRGEPEKTSAPQDITAEDGRIVFDDATIGGATVDGTVECLQGNQS